MRLLGIDYGTKRVGTALSDERGTMAFPNETLKNDEQLIQKIAKLVAEKEVTMIVVGKSHDLDNEPNAVQEKIETFIANLKKVIACEIAYEAEQFTTQAALRIQGRNEQTDASAAALILDSYITKQT